jgi:glycosyltransferase involved in cell wall biosynthesis
MPALNEEATIGVSVRRLLAVDYPCPVELLVVDDGSTDRTAAEVTAIDDPRLTLLRHEVNQGKGAAVRTGVRAATGTHVLVFDADLEYDPHDIPGLLAPVLAGRANVVYGARLFGNNTVYQSFRYAVGNRVMTTIANILYDAALTDLHTCLKLFPLPLVRALACTEPGFGYDTQVTARALMAGIRPFEVAISYHSRRREEGKKINWRHAVQCVAILAQERVRSSGDWRPEARILARIGPSTGRPRPHHGPHQHAPHPLHSLLEPSGTAALADRA